MFHFLDFYLIEFSCAQILTIVYPIMSVTFAPMCLVPLGLLVDVGGSAVVIRRSSSG